MPNQPGRGQRKPSAGAGRPTQQNPQQVPLTAEQYAEAMRRRAAAKRKAQEKKRRMYMRRRIIFAILVLALLTGLVFAVKAIFFNKEKAPSTGGNSSSVMKNVSEPQSAVTSGVSASQSAQSASSPQSVSQPAAAAVGDGSVFAVTALANANNPIPSGYVPEVEKVDNAGHEFDKRASAALKKMISEGNATGLQLMICSAYRSNERQTTLFNEMKADFISSGLSEQEAYDKTKTIRAVPGTSEHETALAADIVSVEYQVLDDGYEKTPEYKWLRENCAEYGFILRYPREKTAITGVIYEPWHYRYVGVEMAKKIMEQNICLEEYVELNK